MSRGSTNGFHVFHLQIWHLHDVKYIQNESDQ